LWHFITAAFLLPISVLRHNMRALLLGTEVMYYGNYVGDIKVELHMFLTSALDYGI